MYGGPVTAGGGAGAAGSQSAGGVTEEAIAAGGGSRRTEEGDEPPLCTAPVCNPPLSCALHCLYVQRWGECCEFISCTHQVHSLIKCTHSGSKSAFWRLGTRAISTSSGEGQPTECLYDLLLLSACMTGCHIAAALAECAERARAGEQGS